MHILHLVHQYMPEHVGGVELYTHWLAHALARQGHQNTIFYRRSAAGAGQEQRTENGVHVRAAWAGEINPSRRFLATFRDPLMAQTFERALDEVQPDLVHIQHLMGLPVALIRSIQQRGQPFTITLWDFWWVCANANLLTNHSQQVCAGPRGYLNCVHCALTRAGHPRLWPAIPPLTGLLIWRNHLLRQVTEAAHTLIAPTEFVRRWYTAYGVPTEKIRVLSPGLEHIAAMQPQRSNSPLRFVYIGGLSQLKGVHILLQAFGQVQGPKELWIAGDESSDPTYVARLRAQATPGVRFLGKLTREGVWKTLAQVDVVVAPSLCYETFSFIVSEAFAVGVPVIASHLGALADRVRDGIDGLLIPPGDVNAWRTALQRLVDEPDLLEQLRVNVRPPMMIDEHVDHMQALYAELIDEKTRA